MNTKNDKMAGYGISYNIDIAFIRAMSMLKWYIDVYVNAHVYVWDAEWHFLLNFITYLKKCVRHSVYACDRWIYCVWFYM
jgi:hypothetical protein